MSVSNLPCPICKKIGTHDLHCLHAFPKPGQAVGALPGVVATLSEADIRRIVREELGRADPSVLRK